jgi:hypothetical protein
MLLVASLSVGEAFNAPRLQQAGGIMRRVTSFIAVLICIAIATIVAAASASATEVVWVVNGKTLKSGEARTVNLKLTKPKVKWEDGTTKFEIECKKATGESELKGGLPGTDKVVKLTFEECLFVKGGTSCKLSAGGVISEEVPGWPTELKKPLLVTTDDFAGVRFSLALTGCEKVSFSKTWVFKGPIKAVVSNEAGKVKLSLPTLAGGAELETETDEASLSGPGELEDKAGAKLSVEEATGHWFNEAGERLAEGLRTNVLAENVGNTIFVTKLEGVEVEMVCAVFEGEGWIENPTGGAGKDHLAGIDRKCTVPKPGGTCKITKGFRQTTESVLAYKGTSVVDEFKNELLQKAVITIEGCENAALNKGWELTGTAVAEPVNEKSSLKFTSTSGSALKIGGQAATLTSEEKIEVEGGGKIQVG